jgi:NitT/TauT family transport system substrate-binding protein
MKMTLVPLFALVLLSCGGPATDSSLIPVRIAIGGRAAVDFIPVYLANGLGHFRDEGLNVTLQDFPGTSKAMQAMLGGSADVVAGGYEAAVKMTAEGQPVHAIAILQKWPPLLIVIAPGREQHVREISDLRGRVIGVSAPGSTTHDFLNYLLVRNGLLPSDVSAVGVGVNFSLAAAVRQSQVDAAVTGPFGLALLTENANPVVLADCRTAERAQQTLGTSILPGVALLTRNSWSSQNSETSRRLGKAMRRVLVWMGTHSAEEVARAMPSEYKPQNEAVYLRAVREALPAFSPDGMMPPDGPAAIKNFLAASSQRMRDANMDLSTTWTNRFVSIN